MHYGASVRPRRSLVGSLNFESRTPFYGQAASSEKKTCAVRGKNSATPRAQFSFPVAGGQHAAVLYGAPAFRRRRPPVDRRPGFKLGISGSHGIPWLHADWPLAGIRPRGRTRPRPRVKAGAGFQRNASHARVHEAKT